MKSDIARSDPRKFRNRESLLKVAEDKEKPDDKR